MPTNATAFVIMPFSEDFETVYTGLIKHSLEGLGFDVQRADDIENQRNILRDILEKISTSDLVIADLTGLNPNVFYELGVAHALKKPVILLTQVIEDVPFDLQSYRLVEYSTHFDRIDEARELLKNYGNGFQNGTIRFGNPVTDFLPGESHSEVADQSIEAPVEIADDGDDLGFLDHTIALTEGSERIAQILKGSANDLNALTLSLEVSSSEMNRLNSNPNADTPRAIQSLSRRLAEKIDAFTQTLKGANSEYSDLLRDMEDSLEFVIAFQIQDLNDSSGSEKLLSELSDLQATATYGRDSFLSLASQMDSVPRMERRLNRALSSGSAEIRAMASNIDRHIATVSRIQQKYGKAN